VKTPNKAHSIAIAGPILPGKEKPWRRFLQELAGSRSQEYATLKQRLEVHFRVQRRAVIHPLRSSDKSSPSGPLSCRTQQRGVKMPLNTEERDR